MDVGEKSSNEKRLIDANALQRVLLPITSAFRHEYGSLGGAVSGVMKHIDSAPTIDAVPVVRCWECKHCDPENYHCDHHMGTSAPLKRKPDDFCSYGEHKEGAD